LRVGRNGGANEGGEVGKRYERRKDASLAYISKSLYVDEHNNTEAR